MSLRKYLRNNKIDQVENDQEFKEAEYNAVQTYCEICAYLLSSEDLEIIKDRQLEKDFLNWKETYVEDLWEEFNEVPIDPKTNAIEEPWKYFLPGTPRGEILRWFKENFGYIVEEQEITRKVHGYIFHD